MMLKFSTFISAIITIILHISLILYLGIFSTLDLSGFKLESSYGKSRKIFLIDKMLNDKSKNLDKSILKKRENKKQFQVLDSTHAGLHNLSDLGISRNSKDLPNTVTEAISDKIGRYGDDLAIKDNPQLSGTIYQYLYNYIASNLQYPAMLRKRKIEGYVTVRIVFDSKGNFKKELTNITSNSRYLKVLVSRTFKTIFNRPLPFNLKKIIGDSPIFFFDASFRFESEANMDKMFVDSNVYINQNHLSFLIQNDSASLIGFRQNQEGLIKLGINYEDAVDWAKLNFTTAGKLRKIFEEEQVERYKNDPDWD